MKPETADTKIITTEGVSKIFNPGLPDELTAVKNVSVAIARGKVTVLQGPSGSGKTTLLSLLGCMSRPSMGRIMVNNRDVAKLPERFLTAIRRSTFGFIFQQFNLIRGITVLENVMLPLYPLDTPLKEIERRAVNILDDLNLLHKKEVTIQRLSGGEQQRVAIARALINEPEIILADEPTAHLDTHLSHELIEILMGLNRNGKTIVIATHDPVVAEHDFVDTIITMRDGVLQ